MSKVFNGSCLCGRVSFQVEAEPIQVSCCHCTNCKKYTGTAFTTNVIFPAGTAKVTKGEEVVRAYHDGEQDSGNALIRRFCSNCATPLWIDGGDFGRTLAVFYSALDGTQLERKKTGPQVEYYVKDREEWVKALEGAEQAWTKPGRDA